jgi:hypothetical protein
MNRSRLSLLILALAMTLFAIATPSNVAGQDRIIIQPRRVVVLRSGKDVRDFPERKRAIVRYPMVRGLSDAAVLRRIQNFLTMKNVFDHTLEEFRRNSGFIEFEGKNWVRDKLKKLQIGVKDLNEFSVSDKGVTFLFDAGFPHAIQALQPEGEYFFSYAEIRPYIKRDGPLSVFK